MTRFLTSCTAAALLLATGAANAQMSPAPNATAPANPAAAGTAMQRPGMASPAPAPMPAPMPASAPAAAPMAPAPMAAKPMATHGRKMAAKPMKHMAAGKPGARARNSGDAAVDSLNDQSLARARAGQ